MAAWWRKVGRSADLARTRREMHAELNRPDERPAPPVQITRRTFIHRSVLAGAAGAATYGWFPLINTLDFAYGQQAPFRFAWVSDNHLYPKDVNTRFVEKTIRAFKEVQAMSPAADFMIHGGDLAQLGDPVELDLGADLLKEVTDPEGASSPGSTTGTSTWARSGPPSSASPTGRSTTRASGSSGSTP